MLSSFQERNRFKGIKIANMCPTLSHLFFADNSLLFFRATEGDCAQLKLFIDEYDKASGHVINFEKFGLSFSPNTRPGMIDLIKLRLAILVVQGHEIYLGLPTFSSKSKRVQLTYLLEKVVNRIYGWGNKFFSSGGKEVLINSVV